MFEQKQNERKGQTAILYHGTSMSRAVVICRQGFLRKETASGKIFLTRSRRVARGYAKRRARSEDDSPALIKCSIDLDQYNSYELWGNGIYVFRHECIGSENIVEVSDLRSRRHRKLDNRKEVRVELPMITLNFSSSQAAIAYWINSSFLCSGQAPVREDHTAVSRIKQWLIIQANNGRTGIVPEGEILKEVGKYFPFGSDT